MSEVRPDGGEISRGAADSQFRAAAAGEDGGGLIGLAGYWFRIRRRGSGEQAGPVAGAGRSPTDGE